MTRLSLLIKPFLRGLIPVALFAMISGGQPRRAEARSDPARVSALLQEGTQLIELGRLDEAETVLEELVDLDPTSALGYAELGRAQALNRRWLRAEVSLRKARQLGQADLRTLVFLGSALWENTKFEESETVFQEAIERYPGSPFPKSQLGRLWLWQGRYEEAVGYLRQAAARNPAPDVFLDLADALRGAGETDEAILAYEQAIRRAPDLMKAHYGLAQLLQQKGESERAQRHLERFYELYQEDQAAARTGELERGEIDRGRDLLRRGKTAEAIAHLDSLPPSTDGLSVLAEAYAQAGDSTKAIETLERAVVLDPGNSELRRRLSEKRLAADREDG